MSCRSFLLGGIFYEQGAPTMKCKDLLKRLSRVDGLLIDELGYAEPKPGQINNFFRLVENRYNKKPTLITTNLGYKEWPKFLGNGPLWENQARP